MAARDGNSDYGATSLVQVMNHELARAVQYEQQITALEKELALELRNAREKSSLYKEKVVLAEEHIHVAMQENRKNAPMITRALDNLLEMIREIEWRLPGIRSQLLEIKNVYDLGRPRAKALQADLEWKAKSNFVQWRSTLLGKSPLSYGQVKREWLKLLWRLVLFALVLFLFLSSFRAFTRPS